MGKRKVKGVKFLGTRQVRDALGTPCWFNHQLTGPLTCSGSSLFLPSLLILTLSLYIRLRLWVRTTLLLFPSHSEPWAYFLEDCTGHIAWVDHPGLVFLGSCLKYDWAESSTALISRKAQGPMSFKTCAKIWFPNQSLGKPTEGVPSDKSFIRLKIPCLSWRKW